MALTAGMAFVPSVGSASKPIEAVATAAGQQRHLRGDALGEGARAAAEGRASWVATAAPLAAAAGSAVAGLTAASRSRKNQKRRASARVVRAADAKTTVVPEVLENITDVDPSAGPEGTYQCGIDFAGWLVSAKEEIDVDGLRVEGTLPAWLRGSLVHAGPAKFEFGDDEFVDWVDGQAMLYRIRITGDGKCEYKNRWLDTWNHRQHREAGHIAVRETCSRPSIDNPIERFMYMFNPPNNENGNLHISRMCGNSRPVSMSVGSAILEFELDDMKTLGKVPYADDMSEAGPLIFHAEPHCDHKTGEWFTLAIQLKIDKEAMGLKPEYVVYSVKPTESKEAGVPVKRNLITRIQSEYPSPVHTIGMTDKYIIMIQIPYPLNWDGMLNAEAKWLMTGKYEGNLNDYNTWQPERPTLIRLIDRVTGEQQTPFETDPLFFFHVCNSYGETAANGDEIVVTDVVCYNEPPVGFPLRQARSGDVESWRGGGGEVRRFTMNVTTGDIDVGGWPDNCFDEPKINPKVDGQKYDWSFGVVDVNGTLRLTKINHTTHEQVYWEEQDIDRELPWQPVFVPEPYNDKEDAGVLLSFVRDQPTGNTFCVVIDAETFRETARIHLPEGHHVPLHGHGDWMQGTP